MTLFVMYLTTVISIIHSDTVRHVSNYCYINTTQNPWHKMNRNNKTLILKTV
jgi:hypothetical protein